MLGLIILFSTQSFSLAYSPLDHIVAVVNEDVIIVEDIIDSGMTLKKSIDWMQHFYGFYLDEPIRTAVLFYKAVSPFKPNYYRY